MLISEKYKLSGDENNIMVEELKIITSTNKETKEQTSRQEWKPVAYTSTIEGALNFIAKREVSLVLGEDVENILKKIKELTDNLGNIKTTLIQKAEIKVVESKKKDKNIKEELEDYELEMIMREEEEESEEEIKNYNSWS